ncbi:MAG: hypothetical protein P8X48_12130 [Acidiferrobacteraceae bacterium]|jgi:hypothetical protein
MKPESRLLLVDAIINLVLGVVLIFFPGPVVAALGVPSVDSAFYPSILGAVLFGIGIALLVQRRAGGGLGLRGAVAINLSGGVVLVFWLLFGHLQLPVRGLVFLWALAAVLVGISTVELVAAARRKL